MHIDAEETADFIFVEHGFDWGKGYYVEINGEREYYKARTEGMNVAVERLKKRLANG